MMALDEHRREALLEVGSARRGVYTFLSAAFLQSPDRESISRLCQSPPASDETGQAGLDSLQRLVEYAREAQANSELIEQARREFMDLFRVPGGKYVPPYESVHRDSREVAGKRVSGLLMGQSAVDVRKWYRLAALEISDEYKDLPDHIGLELNYLAYLCGKEAEFAHGGEESRLQRTWEMQRDFLAAHVVCWVEDLRTRIREKSDNVYFRAVADLCVEFTGRDLATLEAILGPSCGSSFPRYEHSVP
jgi:TorA maturation chaperone TorD